MVEDEERGSRLGLREREWFGLGVTFLVAGKGGGFEFGGLSDGGESLECVAMEVWVVGMKKRGKRERRKIE
ncbi:uncharacterized protein G2W53_044558 [Senna tora]|uniref:Uncharacterized protein n=1 Tax=Senna tora TaxID=362788 RepID=A0A834W063_9FABA|nr:uncharacterized protein G2W53_044558 [Senna tora]